MKTAIIAGSIIVAGLMAAVGPSMVESHQQRTRDKSIDCALYRAQVAVDRVNGQKYGTELQRQKYGCSASR